ncbi:hypothetical protein ACSS6W_000035 [Trichoderma asperelloides]
MSTEPKLELGEPRPSIIPEEPYSAFSGWQKRWIVILMASVGCLGTLSSFVYFPAIPQLADHLHVSVANINLTITVYLIVAAIAPTIVGNSADTIGRRPTVAVCLVIYLGADIGLALSPSFAALLCFRILQAAGISGTFAITFGVLGDLFTPAERGSTSGIMSFVLNTPPSFGPVLSGLLMQRWGWRSIFWFLTTASACFLLVIALCLPETSRLVVGNGSTSTTYGARRPILPLLLPKSSIGEKVSKGASNNKGTECISCPNPLKTLSVLRKPATLLIICAMAIYYAIYSSLQASLSSLFSSTYKTSSLVTGLIYLPFGVGCGLGAVLSGKVLDIEYRRTAARLRFPLGRRANHDLACFPIERARLGSLVYALLPCCLCIAGYGWSIQYELHMAVPLILQFLIGLPVQGIFTAIGTLLVDTHPGKPASAQAANNFVRCATAGAGLAIFEPALGRLGPGWTFVVAAASGLVAAALLFWVRESGLSWRRRSRLSQANENGSQ